MVPVAKFLQLFVVGTPFRFLTLQINLAVRSPVLHTLTAKQAIYIRGVSQSVQIIIAMLFTVLTRIIVVVDTHRE